MAQIKKRPSRNAETARPASAMAGKRLISEADNTIVLVVGMHRSGTSLLSNILQYLGCDMVDDAPHKNEWNAKGYWEREDFTVLQDAILAKLSAPWGSAGHSMPFPRNWWRLPTLKPLRLQLKEKLTEQFSARSGRWGFKDPRTTRLIPLWREVCSELGLRAKCVVAVRDPASSIASLIKRDGFSQDYAETLWLTYNFEMLETLNFDASEIVFYEEWFDQPLRQAQSLISSLDLKPGFASEAEMASVLGDIISPDLRHFSTEQKQALQVSALTNQTYRAFKEFAQGGRDQLKAFAEDFHRAQRVLSGWAAECRRLADDLAASRAAEQKYSAEIAQTQQGIEAKQKSIVDIAAHRDLLIKEVKGLKDQLQAAAEKSSSVQANNAASIEADAKLAMAQKSVAVLVQERDGAARESHRLSDEITRLNALLEAQKTQAATQEGAFAKEQDALKADLESLRGNVTELESTLVSRDEDLNLAYDEIHLHRRVIHEAESRAKALEEQKKQQNEDIARLQAQAEKLSDGREKLETALKKAEETEHSLRGERESLADRIKTVEAALAKAQEMAEGLRNERGGLLEQTSSLEEALKEAEGTANGLLHEREELTEQTSLLETALKKTQETAEELGAERTALTERVSSLEAALARAQETAEGLRDEREGLVERGDSLDRALTATQLELHTLSGTLAQRDEALEQREAELSSLRQELGSLETSCESLAQQAATTVEIRSRALHPELGDLGMQDAVLRLQRLWSTLKADLEKARPLFDPDFYLSVYSDVAAAGVDPFLHFSVDGWQEGRNPNIAFSTSDYLDFNPDVRAARINPLLHYAVLGGVEERRTGGLFDNEFYTTRNPDVITAGINPLQHFIEYGLAEGRPFAQGVDLAAFREQGDDFLSPMTRFRDVVTRLKSAFDDVETIELQVSDIPVLTIALPAGRDMAMLATALHSFAVAPPGVDFEVVLLDEGLMPGLSLVQSKWRGVRVHRLARKGGWATAMNAAVAVAQAPHVAFLSPEIRPRGNWAREILETFKTHPDAAIVGGKVTDITGTLRHGGGLVWGDGSLSIRGHGQDPSHPAYSYARPVDQLPHSFMTVRRSTFLQLGGLDERYETADYAVADLCLTIRAGRGKSWYQPLASAVDFNDTPPLLPAAADLNRLKQQRPHSLAALPRDSSQPGSELRDRIGQILMISQAAPTPDKDAGSVIQFAYLHLLGELGYQLTFVPEHTMTHDGHYTEDIQRAGVQYIHRPYYQNLWEFVRDHGHEMDMVLLCRAPMAGHYLRIITPFCDGAKMVVDTVDLHHLREEREAELEGSAKKRKAAAQTRKLEMEAIAQADMTIIVSDFEQDYLARELPDADTAIIPLILDCPGRQADFADLVDICYIGGYRHMPNVDAVKYFVAEIWPLVRKELPGVRFRIMGSHIPDEIAALASEHIIVDGFVPDLATSLARCRLSVAPLRFGAGIKGKVGSSLSFGIPCVATSVATEGMGFGSRDGVVHADGAEAFAEAVVQLYQDESQWYRMSEGGMQFVRTHYSREATRNRFKAILNHLGLPHA